MKQRLGRALSWIILLGVAVLLGLAFGRPLPPIPSFQEVRAAYRPSDVQLLDRYGQVLHELRTDPTRRRLPWTPLPEISPALRAAVIFSEDRRFYRHGGVDGRALGAAAFSVLRWPLGGPRRGASTISMQGIALLRADLRPRGGLRAFGRKWRQMRLAWVLERRWSKAEILEAYLNLVTFRGELQGVAAAASVLLGKAPHGITEAEAAVLAVLLRAPNAGPAAVARRALDQSPESSSGQALPRTRSGVQGKLWALRAAQGGTATRGEIEAAVARALDAPPGAGPRVTLAPHLASQLLQALPTSAPVRSSLDGALQRVAAESRRVEIRRAQP